MVAPLDELADDDVVDGRRVVLDFLREGRHLLRPPVVSQGHVPVGLRTILVHHLELCIGRDDRQLLEVGDDP